MTTKITLTLFLVIELFSFYDCTINAGKNKKNADDKPIENIDVKTATSFEKVLSDSVIIGQSNLDYLDFSLKVETYYLDDDAIFDDEYIDHIVLKQEITFIQKDSVLKKMIFPVMKLSVQAEKRGIVEIQENNVISLSVVRGQENWLYKIYGGGVTGVQSEFYGLYNFKGDLLWFSYSSYQILKSGATKNIPNSGYGDFDKVLKEYGIDEAEFNRPEQKIKLDFF